MTTTPELPRCDTELRLSLGRRPATGEHEQSGLGLSAATDELQVRAQATAVLRVARRAAAAEEDDGAASGDGGAAAGLSVRRSMESFLRQRRRREARRLRGVAVDGATTSPSSSYSFSCLTE